MSDYKPLRPAANVPRHSLLHPERRYVPAAQTNIAVTFERIRAEQAATKPANVRTIKRSKA